ncbi:arginine-glutamic acid dipeptide repeats protein isoform X2 [Etheostoma cragini]|uniref:arginine-glutamic acid dipeptide repeats protein isoform X2 n=1 Tax=Etheostoma cragini TaxID=417921 RepID=UPI00155F4E12|nr:arginine-glutamic acid dipeptide repeats protein isoform X2 [Etheostoma cragini]
MSSDSDKEEEEEEEEEEPSRPYMVAAGSLEEDKEISDEKRCREGTKEASGRRLPRRRWSRRTGGDSVLMVKSMLDLRLLDSYRPDTEAEQEGVKPRPLDVSPRWMDPGEEARLHRTNQEMGSTISLQVNTAWAEDDEARANKRPEFIHLSNRSPDREPVVLYPDQWEDRLSLAGSEFQVKEVCPSAGGRQDKPSPDSGCSLGFSSSLSSPGRPAGDDSEPLSGDGNSSELEMEEDEDEGGRGGDRGLQAVPQTPDQEAFLKEHFVKLADLSDSGSPSKASHSSSESLSISSRFLSQNAAGSRTVIPLPSRTTSGGGEGVKARPLVSEVRPLMEQNHNSRVSWKPDQTHKQSPDQTHEQSPNQIHKQTPDQTHKQTPDQTHKQTPDQTHKQSPDQTHKQSPDQIHKQSPDQTHKQTPDQIQKQSPDQIHKPTPDQTHKQSLDQTEQGWDRLCARIEGEGAAQQAQQVQQAHRPSPLKKKVQTSLESRRNLGPAARAAASHLNFSSGLRKTQSVQNLLTDTGDSSLSPAAPHQLFLPLQRPTTLPSSPRRPPSTTLLLQRPSPASPRSPLQETAIAAPSVLSSQRKSSTTSAPPAASRSYMSPTASSMAKMLRSVSVGDGLNNPDEDPAATIDASSQVKDVPPPSLPLTAVVPSNAALATPPQAAVIPVVIAASSGLGNHVTPAPRGLQARVPGSSRPLPDKPSLASLSSPSTRPPPVSFSPLTPPPQEAEPQPIPVFVSPQAPPPQDVAPQPVPVLPEAPPPQDVAPQPVPVSPQAPPPQDAEPQTASGSDHAGLDSHPPPLVHPFILSSLAPPPILLFLLSLRTHGPANQCGDLQSSDQ